MAESLRCLSEAITTLSIGYTPMRNKKLFKKKRKYKKKKKKSMGAFRAENLRTSWQSSG